MRGRNHSLRHAYVTSKRASSNLMRFSVCFPLQRAKISQGTKAPEEKTINTISKLDNNGNRDRMKLTDFNFLMVLGKGSFGKVHSKAQWLFPLQKNG